MADNKSERLEMRIDAAFLESVDEWRRQQPDLPPRAEAVRRLVEKAIADQPRRAEFQRQVAQSPKPARRK